jgi:1-aminocyclopropane-1-carboxylate deaminase/D-cysteine desulfhydrase-like pyridoxal-dependent ACC family enzyme
LGQGITACARQFSNMRVIAAYPASKGSVVPEALRIANQLGAEILPVRAGRVTISFAAARREVERRGGIMLPFGLECYESVEAVARQAATLPSEAVDGGTVVVSCGSGVTLAGLVLGLDARPFRYIGVSSGRSISAIKRCLLKYNASLDRVTLVPPQTAYAKPWDGPVPFPSHSHYDKKAWAHLRKRIASLRHPILFWNVGADGTGLATIS